MTKNEYLESIREKIKGLPEDSIKNAIDFYSEAIDDRIEDGLTEEQAIAAVGTPDEVAEKIMMDSPITKLISAKAKPDRGLKGWEIALLIISSPIWLTLLFVLVILLFALLICIIAVIISLVAVVLALFVSGLAVFIWSIKEMFTGSFSYGLFQAGLALVVVGVSLFFVIPVKAAIVGMCEGFGKLLKWIKRKLITKKKNKE